VARMTSASDVYDDMAWMMWQVTEPYDRADVAGDEAVRQLTWLARGPIVFDAWRIVIGC
jgi:hypothetical protein